MGAGRRDAHAHGITAMPDLRRSTDRVPLWLAFLAVGALALVVHASLETGSLTQSFVYDAIGASAILVALLAVIRHAPDRRLPWLLMIAGQALFVAGDLAWNWYEVLGEDPFPSIADVLYLAGYPFLALGLFMLIRRRLSDGDRGGLLDAAILTAAVAILSWTFFMQPQVVGAELDPLSLAISLAYPIADLIVIGVAMGLLTTPGARTPSFRLLALSLVLLLVGDQVYALQNLDGTYVSGGPIDTLYLVAYLTFGAAVAHPSMRRLTDPHPVAVTWLGPVRLFGLAAAMMTGPLLVSMGPAADGGLAVVAIGSALLSLLVLVRLAGLVGLLERDVAARRVLEARLSFQAFHDPLTGLANRRRFVERADALLDARTAPGTIAALFLDLDDFKTINDGLGHAAGDDLLVAVGQRLSAALRETDLAARLGGDEFGILLTDIPDAVYAESISDRLLGALSAPFHLGRATVTIGASIGIAVDTAVMAGVDDLLGDADIAMYQAKALGKGRHQVFTPPTPDAETSDAPDAGPEQRLARPGPARPSIRLDRPARARHRLIRPTRLDSAMSMEIPLFPLHTVLCPGIVLPLHIFEERYRAMTQRCLETGEPFGVVLIRDGREIGTHAVATLAGVGAFAEIREAGRYPDGRFDLLAAATGRFVIEDVDAQREPYLVATVSPLDDEVGDEPRAERLAAAAIRRFVRYLDLMRARDGETTEVLDIRVEIEAPDEVDVEPGLQPEPAMADRQGTGEDPPTRADLSIPDDPTVLSYLLSGIVQVELPRRQALLEADTTVERLEGLIALLEREVTLLGRRLRYFSPDPKTLGGAVRS